MFGDGGTALAFYPAGLHGSDVGGACRFRHIVGDRLRWPDRRAENTQLVVSKEGLPGVYSDPALEPKC